MKRSNGGFFCVVVGVGLLIAAFCPIEIILVLAAVALVVYGIFGARR